MSSPISICELGLEKKWAVIEKKNKSQMLWFNLRIEMKKKKENVYNRKK